MGGLDSNGRDVMIESVITGRMSDKSMECKE